MPAIHSRELAFVFGADAYLNELLSYVLPKDSLDESFDSTEEDRIGEEMTELISSYWVNFVKNGNPNGEGLSEWNTDGETGSYMLFEHGNCGTKTDRSSGKHQVLFEDTVSYFCV